MDSEKTQPLAGESVWRYRLLLSAVAVLAVAASIVAGIALWSSSRQGRAAAPVMSASSSPYTNEQIEAAKTDACDAVTRTDGPMTDVAQRFWAVPAGTPEASAAMAAFQRVTLVEIEYLKSRTRPETPEAVRTGVQTYVSAVLATVDGVTRGVPVSQKVAAVKAAGAQLDKACKEG